MCSFCLDTVLLFDNHTGQNLAEVFQDILRNWKLILLVPPQIMVVILSVEWSCWGGPE